MYVKQPFQTILLAACITCPAISDDSKTKENERPSEQRLKIYELYAKDRFAQLNKKSAGRLELLFSNFGESFQVHAFIQEEKELYQSFLVAALENSMTGGILFMGRVTNPEG